jgi:hypothetical protein
MLPSKDILYEINGFYHARPNGRELSGASPKVSAAIFKNQCGDFQK